MCVCYFFVTLPRWKNSSFTPVADSPLPRTWCPYSAIYHIFSVFPPKCEVQWLLELTSEVTCPACHESLSVCNWSDESPINATSSSRSKSVRFLTELEHVSGSVSGKITALKHISVTPFSAPLPLHDPLRSCLIVLCHACSPLRSHSIDFLLAPLRFPLCSPSAHVLCVIFKGQKQVKWWSDIDNQ